MSTQKTQCPCSCHKIGQSNGECCDCHLCINYDAYAKSHNSFLCPQCGLGDREKKYFSSPTHDYMQYSCKKCGTVLAESETPYLINPMYTEDETQSLSPQAFALLLSRIEKLEQQGTDINLRFIHDALEKHIEGFNGRLVKFEEKLETLRSFYAEYGHRLKIMEDIVTPTIHGCPKAESLLQGMKRLHNTTDKLCNRMNHIEKCMREIPPVAYEPVNVMAHGFVETDNIIKRLLTIENFISQNYRKDIDEASKRFNGLDQVVHDFIKSANGRIERLHSTEVRGELAILDRIRACEAGLSQHVESINMIDRTIANLLNNIPIPNDGRPAPMHKVSLEEFKKMYPQIKQPCRWCDQTGQVHKYLVSDQAIEIDGHSIKHGETVLLLEVCPKCKGEKEV